LGVLAADVTTVGIEDKFFMDRISPNTFIFLMDENSNLRADAGELCVAGVQLSAGYVNDEAQTAEAFTYPFIDNKHIRIYKTGDQFEYVERRGFAYCGRKDNQVKLNGYRTELEEIEHAANAVAGTSSAAVVIPDGVELRLRLYVARPVLLEVAQFKSQLRKKIPAFMFPVEVIFVEELPVTAQGKLARSEIRRWVLHGDGSKVD
jgi:acyl-coenzyme A synthetase/AMP-(fatty) acid ligase